MKTDQLIIDVWSDVMCPFCYLGDKELANALEQFEHRDSVTIRYHSYQLMPELPADAPVDLDELLAKKRGFSIEQIQGMNDQIAARGAAVGIEYRFDRAVTVNSRTAHRLTHFADEYGKQHGLVMRLFKAYFTDGLNTGDRDTLADLAEEVGLDRNEALGVIDSDAYDDAVTVDIVTASKLGITGVPFFVLNNTYAVSGAQPASSFLQALETAWAGERAG